MSAAGAAAGWGLGLRRYSEWTQQFAVMDTQNLSEVLANVPLVKYDPTFDFGSLFGNVGTLTHEFHIVNTGRGALKLGKPEISSDALKVECAKSEAAPDETLCVTVTYTPTEETSDFSETVRFLTNAPTTPELELTVQGAVYPSVWVEQQTVEIAGVPTTGTFKTSNRIYGMDEKTPLELSNFHVTDERYASFFEFEFSEMYSYDFSQVSPTPASGKIVTIIVKPGLPARIFTVTVEGETNSPDVPKVTFNMDFKIAAETPFLGGTAPSFVPILTTPAKNEPPTETPNETPAESESIQLD